jgi:hypothetical protein
MTDARIIARDGAYFIRAGDVREGDLLDFEGDSIVDPECAGELFDPTPPASVTILWAEYARVDSVEREAADCVRIDTDQGSYGFPPDHEIETTLDDKQGNLVP